MVLTFPNNILVKLTANGVATYNHFHSLKIFEKIEHLKILRTEPLFIPKIVKWKLKVNTQIKKIEKI